MKGGWELPSTYSLRQFCEAEGQAIATPKRGNYGTASDLAKAKIMLAGVAVNLATALLLFTLLALVGMPKIPGIDNQFTVKSDTKIVRQDVLAGLVEKILQRPKLACR